MRLKNFFRQFVWNLSGVFAPSLEKWEGPERGPYDDPFLEEPDAKQREIHYLQFQLAKVRADNYELERKPFELRETIAAIFNEPVERLRSAARFPVRETGSGWIVAAGHCCLCGCDLDIHAFQSERDALLFACLLNAVGYEPPHNIACSPCHAEYMKDCI